MTDHHRAAAAPVVASAGMTLTAVVLGPAVQAMAYEFLVNLRACTKSFRTRPTSAAAVATVQAIILVVVTTIVTPVPAVG